MSRRKKEKRQIEGIDYWKSSSDLMTALILVLLLVIMFLMLYILETPNQELSDNFKHEYDTLEDEDNDQTGADMDDNIADHDGGYGEIGGDDGHEEEDDDDGNGNGNGNGNGEGDDEGEGEDDPGEGDGSKSAVLASLVDAETKKAIPAKDVTFELYSDSKALTVLNTYYPKKKSYKTYKTTEDGTFFLPEKVLATSYYFHQLSDLNGYEIADKVEFTIDGPYDWPDPFLVKIPLYPMRDVIRIQMIDQDNGQAVPGGEFEVIAQEDITTKDDTVRVKKGEVADTIKIDEKGYGESKRLYLGKYKVRQSGIPTYYASNDESFNITLKDLTSAGEKDEADKREDSAEEQTGDNTVNTVRSERTRITFILNDELTGDAVSGAIFDVSGPNINEQLTTNKGGQIVLDDVEKDSTYEFTQVSAPGDYIASVDPVKVKVSAKGRVDGEAKSEIESTNRLLRLDIGVRDVVLRSHLADIKVELFTQSGQPVDTWTTNGSFTEITGLETGKYYVNLNDDTTKKYPVSVTDTAEIQTFNINILTTRSYAAIGVAAAVLVLLIIGLSALIRRARRKRKEEERLAAMKGAVNAAAEQPYGSTAVETGVGEAMDSSADKDEGTSDA